MALAFAKSLSVPVVAQQGVPPAQRPGFRDTNSNAFPDALAAGYQTRLLNMPAVQAELQLTPEQQVRLREIGEEPKWTFPNPQGTAERRNRIEEFRKRMNEVREQRSAFMATLNDDQQARLNELTLQNMGLQALQRDEVARALELTSLQRERIRGIFAERGHSDPAQFLKRETDLAAVLTDGQRAAWKRLQGAPFSFPDVQPGSVDLFSSYSLGFLEVQKIRQQKTLLNMAEVQEDLKLSQEQLSKLREIGELSKLPSERLSELEAHRSSFVARAAGILEATLTADQRVRLTQLRLQADGLLSLQTDEVASALGLTQTQRQRIVSICNTWASARHRQAESPQAVDERRTTSLELREKRDADLAAVLTDDQRTAWKRLQGAPFPFPESQAEKKNPEE